MTDKVDLKLRINGRDHAVRVEPRKTLVDAIREDCGLTGTHIGCEHGVCGACTVIVGGEAVGRVDRRRRSGWGAFVAQSSPHPRPLPTTRGACHRAALRADPLARGRRGAELALHRWIVS